MNTKQMETYEIRAMNPRPLQDEGWQRVMEKWWRDTTLSSKREMTPRGYGRLVRYGTLKKPPLERLTYKAQHNFSHVRLQDFALNLMMNRWLGRALRVWMCTPRADLGELVAYTNKTEKS